MRFIVKDFGPIKNADVILGDFNVLVGPGGTGKSYLAYLIWMLLKMEPNWEVLLDFSGEPIFQSVVKEITNNKEISKDLSDQFLTELMRNYQMAHEATIEGYIKDTFGIEKLADIINENKNEAIIKISNDEDTKRIAIIIKKSGIEIKGYQELLYSENFVINYNKKQRKIVFLKGKKKIEDEFIPVKSQEIDVIAMVQMQMVETALKSIGWFISSYILTQTVGYHSAGNPFILTDSKSGMMRAAPGLIGYALTAPKKEKQFSLNLPDKEMLLKLIIPKKEIKDKEISRIADFIENEIAGEIDIDTKGSLFPEISFKKGGSIYPIIRSYSSIRELAPSFYT